MVVTMAELKIIFIQKMESLIVSTDANSLTFISGEMQIRLTMYCHRENPNDVPNLFAFDVKTLITAHVNEVPRKNRLPLSNSDPASSQIFNSMHPAINPVSSPADSIREGSLLLISIPIEYAMIGFNIVTSTPPAPAIPYFRPL